MLVINNIRGMNTSMPAVNLPNGLVRSITNMLLVSGGLIKVGKVLTTGYAALGDVRVVYQAGTYRFASTVASGGGDSYLLFYDTNSAGYQAKADFSTGADVPTAITLSDTVAAWATNRPYMATFNNKVFLAYNSDVNRLHLWDGTVCRRVGIDVSAAATVANSAAAGAYAPTTRYYKIQWKRLSGSLVEATSELSPSVSFTPSGANTAAVVTKPTTPDAATHWIVYGSADNVNYYNLSGNVAVGTTTWSDLTAPSGYSSNAIAPSTGLYIPPPSCKYLLATDNRLFMAGAWETSGTATQTAPYTSRVWYTDPLGALDNTGEDESVANVTAGRKNWVDCGENDNDAIVGLAGPLDGVVYAFKTSSIWRLVPTGNIDDPYRPEMVTNSLGGNRQDAMTAGLDGQGMPCLYFQGARGGIWRIGVGGTMTCVSQDLHTDGAVIFKAASCVLCWDGVNRTLWVLGTEGTTRLWAYQPDFAVTIPAFGESGGWTSHSAGNSSYTWYAAVFPSVPLNALYNYITFYGSITGGGYTPARGAWAVKGGWDGDSLSVGSSSIVTGVYQPQGPYGLLNLGHPVVERLYPSWAGNKLTLDDAIYGGPSRPGAISQTFDGLAGTVGSPTPAIVQDRYEGLQLSDVSGVRITLEPLNISTFTAIYVPYTIHPR